MDARKPYPRAIPSSPLPRTRSRSPALTLTAPPSHPETEPSRSWLGVHPRGAVGLAAARSALRACLPFAESYKRRIRTAKSLGRLKKETKRSRTRVVRSFPDREACVRSVTALAAEQGPPSYPCLRRAQSRVVGLTRSSFAPGRSSIFYYGLGLLGHSTGSYVTGDAVTPQGSKLGCRTSDPP